MPNKGSVNQILLSDLTTMSFGALSFLPSKLSANTVKLPSFSLYFMMRLLGISLISRYPPSGK